MAIEPNSYPSVLAPEMRLSKNPMLPESPLGAYTDSQYEAAIAQLRAQVSRAYADVLKKLGFMDDATGQFIPGQVETEAWKRKGELDRDMGIAAEEVTNRAQQEGTLFSGLRAQKTGRAQYPFVSAMADIDTQVPLTLADLYGSAAGLVEDYTLGQNQLLAQAAARRAASLPTEPAVAPTVAPELVETAFAGSFTPNLPPSPALPLGNTGTDERGFPIVGRGSGMVSPMDTITAAQKRLRDAAGGSGGSAFKAM